MRISGRWSALLLLLAMPAAAQQPPADEFVTTHHQARIAGAPMRYTARAGTLPLANDDTGAVMGRIFVVAYTADRPAGAPPRPITFIWNGGPGANSSDLHLVAFGPRGLETPPTYPEWAAHPPARLIDRMDSWLATSDLVFIDPIGTGYSRAASAEARALAYTTFGDVETVAEAIRVYRTRFDAWDAPMFIAGESYGTTRAMGVAEALERRRQHLAGVILISGAYEAGQDVPAPLRTALDLPMLTATAYYHHRLAPDLQALPQAGAIAAADHWARATYAPALARIDALTATERSEILAGVMRFTGVAREDIDAKALAIGKDRFADRLLAGAGRTLGRYDMRFAGPARAPGRVWLPTADPSIAAMIDVMQGTSPLVLRYLRDDLGYRSDLLYHGPFGEGFHPAPLADVTQGATGPLSGIYTDWTTLQFKSGPDSGGDGAVPPLARAMMRNPALLVWNVTGLYDGSCAEKDEALARTPAPLRPRVRNSCYGAGHMVYTDPTIRTAMAHDFARFVADALARRAAAGTPQ